MAFVRRNEWVPKKTGVKSDTYDPLGNKACILSRRNTAHRAAAASEQEIARLFADVPQVIIDRSASLFCKLKLHWLAGLSLANDSPADGLTLLDNVIDFERREIAPT